ncbi:hypothetical protein HPB51_013282 [Rhipicephalus microplus]|uniref:Uncharacterized protein n=1 Tax=Rhipicephalus microplus TaxID=6941 RepID=A0A9J6EGX3_RHIMP|nr:hypothetical protein HPB51_013282 [Rhipicephalus microplus]
MWREGGEDCGNKWCDEKRVAVPPRPALLRQGLISCQWRFEGRALPVLRFPLARYHGQRRLVRQTWAAAPQVDAGAPTMEGVGAVYSWCSFFSFSTRVAHLPPSRQIFGRTATFARSPRADSETPALRENRVCLQQLFDLVRNVRPSAALRTRYERFDQSMTSAKATSLERGAVLERSRSSSSAKACPSGIVYN